MTSPDTKLHLATRVIHGGQSPEPGTGAVMPPIFATSTFAQESPGVHKGLDYGRSHNPTRWALERCVADLESGSAGFAFASGLAAISAVLDLLLHVTTEARHFGSQVADTMTAQLQTLRPSASMQDLRDILDRGLTAVILDSDRFYGLITRFDLLNHLRRTLS